MNTTMNLNAELLRELSYIADNENYLKKAMKIIKELVAQKKEEERIRQAFGDAKLIREGKMKGIPAEDLLNEL